MFPLGTTPKSAHQTGCEIRDDISVEIFHQQHVELVRIHHELHAQVIDDFLIVFDRRIIHGHFSEALQK